MSPIISYLLYFIYYILRIDCLSIALHVQLSMIAYCLPIDCPTTNNNMSLNHTNRSVDINIW